MRLKKSVILETLVLLLLATFVIPIILWIHEHKISLGVVVGIVLFLLIFLYEWREDTIKQRKRNVR